jgi:hypothetical protein
MKATFFQESEILQHKNTTVQQKNAMLQNMIIQLESKSQQNRLQPKVNNGWDRPRPPQGTILNKKKIIPVLLNNNNSVDKEYFPWCNPCKKPHDQDTSFFAKEFFEHGK